MANTRILWRDKWGPATAKVVSSATYQLGASNLTSHHLAEIWQTTGSAADEWAKANLGSGMSIQAFAFLGHNFDATESSVYIEGNASDSWGSPAFSQAITYRANHFIEFFSTQSRQWWRFKFTKNAAADLRYGGKILLGPYYEFTRNPAHDDFSFSNRDTSRIRKNISGQLHADIGVTLRGLKISLPACSTAQADELIELKDTNGTHTPFLISIDHATEPLDWMLYGALTRLSEKKFRHYNGSDYLWDFTLEMEAVR